MHVPLEKRTLAIIIVFSLVVVAIILGVIFPAGRAIRNSEREISNLHQFLERRHRKVAAVRIATSKVREIKETVAEYPNHLFKRGDELKLITQLESIAGEYHVAQKINHSNLDQLTDNRVQLGLSASGDLVAVLEYLAALEQLPYFLTVTELELAPLIERANLEPRQAILNLELTLYVN